MIKQKTHSKGTAKKLKIAILTSDFIPVPPIPRAIPPGSSGAPEYIMSKIADGMVQRGHQVTLFASGDSKTSAKLFSLQKKSTGVDRTIGRGPHVDFEYALISKCYQMANQGKFDIIHSLFDVRTAFFAPFSKVPTLATLHSPLTGNVKVLLKKFPKTQRYISISNAQRRDLPSLHYIRTVYNGVDITDIPFSGIHKNYYMFIGRIRQEKGVAEAIAIARKVKKKLIIAGSHIPGDNYWEKKIKPYIDQKNIIYLGHLERKKIFACLKYAEAFIFPIQYNEPFGLVMAEAMACGVPVVAFKKGAVPEVVKQGETGFIVRHMSDITKALSRVSSIDRRKCRKYVEEKFPLSAMLDGYEAAYYQTLQ